MNKPKERWIVYDYQDNDTEIFETYEKAKKYYDYLTDESRDIVCEEVIFYIAKVTEVAWWEEDKNNPISEDDEWFDRSKKQPQYYWALRDEEVVE